MVVSPARAARASARARDLPVDRDGPDAVSPELIGHAGLGIENEGGSPGRHDLDRALLIGIERLEVDLCCTADARLVVRHDVTTADGAFVADLDLADLRLASPGTLTLDEVVEHLGGRVRLLVDIKMARAAELVGTWLRGRRDIDGFALCTENQAWLLHLRFAAPRAPRWPSFPDLGERRTQRVRRVVADLWRSHADLGGLRRGADDVRRAAWQLGRRPRDSLRDLGGLPWRGRLPTEIARVHDELAADGICVHHWIVSDALVTDAHALGLHLNVWTVNSPLTALSLAARGVDSITTDRPEMVRAAISAGSQPGPEPALKVEARTGRR